jgi:hypothetical protein
MSRLTVPALAATCAALLGTTACSSGSSSAVQAGGSPSTSPSTSASASASATPTHFARLGYSLAVPPGWTSQEGSQDWPLTGSGPPRVAVSTFDDLLSPSSDPRILIGEQPVPDAAPLDQWIDHMRSSGAITYPPGDCNPAEQQTPGTLGGEPARLVAFHCPADGPDAAIVQVLARHAGTGWIVSCFSGSGAKGGLQGLEKECSGWVSSFRFAT